MATSGKYFYTLIALLVAMFLLLGAIAIEASDNSTVAYGANSNVTAHTVCRKVTNGSATGLSVYIPTQTSAEWASFYTNPPAGVSIGSCSIPIATSQSNVNLCTIAGNPTVVGNYVFTISAGVTISSTNTATPALSTGTCWAAGSTLTLINQGAVYGKGGNGGGGSSGNGTPAAGGAGGAAISLSYAMSIDTASGFIYGGGGGGGGGGKQMNRWGYYGGGGGGGGAGLEVSAGGAGGGNNASCCPDTGKAGAPGTANAGGGGGAGSNQGGGAGGAGGAPGTAGSNGGRSSGGAQNGAAGGAAGQAVDMNNHVVTWIAGYDGTQVRGPVSN